MSVSDAETLGSATPAYRPWSNKVFCFVQTHFWNLFIQIFFRAASRQSVLISGIPAKMFFLRRRLVFSLESAYFLNRIHSGRSVENRKWCCFLSLTYQCTQAKENSSSLTLEQKLSQIHRQQLEGCLCLSWLISLPHPKYLSHSLHLPF